MKRPKRRTLIVTAVVIAVLFAIARAFRPLMT
jgi:hypothetical protein